MNRKNSPRPVSLLDRRRIIYLGLGILFLLSVLIAHFYKIQIIEKEKWSREARRQHFFVIQEPALRGKFFSNASIKKNHPDTSQNFVFDIEKFHLYIDPSSIPPKCHDAIANQLLRSLELTIPEKLALRNEFNHKSRSRKLAMWIDQSSRDKIMEWWLPYAREHKIARNALFFVCDYQRSYPYGSLLGQVLHTIQNFKDPKTNQAIPTGGLELYFNSFLTGKQGKRRLMRSPRNAFETGEVIVTPQNGADVYLTINHCLQAICEEEIAKATKKSRAKAGIAIMMDPNTGEILALAQYPAFNPRDYQHCFNHPELIENTRVKAITDANEPGSVMKPITLAIALTANEELRSKGKKPIFSPEDKIASSNGRFKGRSKPIKDGSHIHYFLNMDMALQKSSNIYMARLVESIVNQLGANWYREHLSSFGFGAKTGIELPGESNGVLPTPGKKHANGKLEWSVPTPFSLAMGHNIQATYLQVVRAYAILANGGYLVKPTLVRKIIRTHFDGSQEVLLDNTTEEKRNTFPKVLEPDVIRRVVKAMKFITKPGGTAPKADIRGYTEAGKTGTANKVAHGTYADLYAPIFVGFTPVENAAFVLLVCMDEPEYGYQAGIGKKHHGGTCCAPVFRDIASRALAYLGISPDDPYGYPHGDPRYDSEKADWLPETRRLKEMYETWNNKDSTIEH